MAVTISPQPEPALTTTISTREPALANAMSIQQQPTASMQSGNSAIADSRTVEKSATSRDSSESRQNVERRNFFTIGSTKAEVLALQGTPTVFDPSRFSYGYSHVNFVGDRVVSWIQSPTNPLKVILPPSMPVEVKSYFTVGSTKDDVLAVQGTPTQFTDSVFTYG